MEYKTPQDVKDEKDRDAAGRAYRKALRMTEEAPEEDKRAPVRGQKGYAKGGVTRADGCVTKGHTKGKMVKMAYGGKTCG